MFEYDEGGFVLNVVQCCLYGGACELGRIVFAAQVAEEYALRQGGKVLAQRVGGLEVATVACAGSYAVLQRQNPAAFFVIPDVNTCVAAVLKHFGVVVRLDDEVFGALDVGFHLGCEGADVGHEAEVRVLRLDEISGVCPGIVGNEEWRDAHACELEGLVVGYEVAHRELGLVVEAVVLVDALEDVGQGVDGDEVFFREIADVAAMVGVVVREEYGSDEVYGYAVVHAMLLQDARSDAHVDK